MSFKVYHQLADGTNADICDDLYDTIEEAEAAAMQAASDYSQGGDVLSLAGQEAGPEIVGWFSVEV